VDPDASLEVAGDAGTIAPNVAASLTAIIANHTTSARDFLLSVRDVNPAWVTFRPPALTLGPGQQGSVAVLLNVPADAVVPPTVPMVRLLAPGSGEVLAEAPLSAAAVAGAATVPFGPSGPAAPPPAPLGWRPTRVQALAGGAALAGVVVALVAAVLLSHRPRSVPPLTAGSMSCAGQPTKVASLLSDDRTTAIRLSNPDDSNMQVLRTEPAAVLPGLYDSLLALSDDNAHVAYVTANDESMDEAHLWALNVAAPAQPQELAHIPTGFWAVRPVWSPNDQAVAFLALDPTLAAQHKTQLVLWIAQVDGQLREISGLPQLRPEDFYGDHPVPMCWAVDNKTLIFDGAAGTATSGPPAHVSVITISGTTTASAGTATVTASTTAAGSAAVSDLNLPPITVDADGPAPAGPKVQVQVDTLAGTVQVVPFAPKAPPAAFNVGTPSKPTGTACSMPVFSQNDPAWRFDLMQSGGDQIGNYGCALTSTAMVLNYYWASMTPSKLNACLKGAADPLFWSQAPACTNGVVNGGDRVDFSWPALDKALSSGQLAIVGMLRGQTGMHFIVVTAGGGGNAADYAVTDPWDATTNKTLLTFFNSGYNPAWIVTYSGPDHSCQRLTPPSTAQLAVAVNGVTDGAVYRTPVHLNVTGDPSSLVSANVVNLSLDDFGTLQTAGTPVPLATTGNSATATTGSSATSVTTQANGGITASSTTTAAHTTTTASTATTSSTAAHSSATTTSTTAVTTTRVTGIFTLITFTYHLPHVGLTPIPIQNKLFPYQPVVAGSVVSQEGVYQLLTQTKVNSTTKLTVTKFIIDQTPPHVDVLWLSGSAQAAVPTNSVGAGTGGPAKLLAPLGAFEAQAAPQDGPQSIGPAHLQIQALDTLSGVSAVEYRLDNGPWTAYANDINYQQTLAIAPAGDHQLDVRATDLAGNVSPVQSYTFRVASGTPAERSPTATTQPTASATPTPRQAAPPSPTARPTATATAVAASTSSVATEANPAVPTPTSTTIPAKAASDTPTTAPQPTTVAAVSPVATPTDTPLPATLTPSPTAVPPTRTATATTTPTATATAKPTATATPTATPTVGVARLAFRPSSLSFATQAPQTQSKPAIVTATNTGTAPLSFIGIAINGGNGAFVYGQNDCINYSTTNPLAPSATCTVGIIFYPPDVGADTASLDFTDTGAGSPQHVALSGVAAYPPTPTATPCAPIAQASVGARLFTPSSGNPYVIVNWSSVAGCPPYSGTITAQYGIPGNVASPPYATYPISQPAGSLSDSKMGCYSGSILYTLTLHDNTGRTVTATAQAKDTCVQIN
jgi:hypothetical protein